MGLSLHTPVLLYKNGVKGILIARSCFPDGHCLSVFIEISHNTYSELRSWLNEDGTFINVSIPYIMGHSKALTEHIFDSKHGLYFVYIFCENGGRVVIWAPAHWGLGEIDGLLVPPGKASKLLTDHLMTG